MDYSLGQQNCQILLCDSKHMQENCKILWSHKENALFLLFRPFPFPIKLTSVWCEALDVKRNKTKNTLFIQLQLLEVVPEKNLKVFAILPCKVVE